MRRGIIVSALAACSGDASDADDTDLPAEGDADTDADSDADADTDVEDAVAELTRIGAATVDGSYAGTEVLEAVTETGTVVCRVSYALASVGVRSDCANCDWAYDVQVSGAVVETDEGACLAVVGVDASTVSSLDGRTTGYGYVADYVGHQPVLMTDLRGYWAASSIAEFDPVTFELTYEWEDGVHTY